MQSARQNKSDRPKQRLLTLEKQLISMRNRVMNNQLDGANQ